MTIGNVCEKRALRTVLDNEIEALPCRPASSPGLDPALSSGKLLTGKVSGRGWRAAELRCPLDARSRCGGEAGHARVRLVHKSQDVEDRAALRGQPRGVEGVYRRSVLLRLLVDAAAAGRDQGGRHRLYLPHRR